MTNSIRNIILISLCSGCLQLSAQTQSVTPQFRAPNTLTGHLDPLIYNYTGKIGGPDSLVNLWYIRSLFLKKTDAASTYEVLSNKVTTLDNSTTHYPSTSAVTAALETKQNVLATIYYLSQNGCISDADLSLGSSTFGTDNTSAIQTILNHANSGTPIKIIIDGKYSTNGLRVYSNTTIESSSQGNGLILRNSANAPMFLNADTASGSRPIIDSNIVIRNGTYNFNGPNQIATSSIYGAVTGINMVGVKNFTLENTLLYRSSTYTYWGLNNFNSRFLNNTIITGSGNNKDGFHFNAAQNYVYLDGNNISSQDDAIAFNADDVVLAVYNCTGNQQNIFITNTYLNNGRFGLRFLSSGHFIHNVLVDGLQGYTHAYALLIDNFWVNNSIITSPGFGNVDNVTIKNINVNVFDGSVPATIIKSIMHFMIGVKNLTIDNVTRNDNSYTNMQGLIYMGADSSHFQNVNISHIYDSSNSDTTHVPAVVLSGGSIKNLTISDVYKTRHVITSAPIFRLVKGTIGTLTMDNIKTDSINNIVDIFAAGGINHIKINNSTRLNYTAGKGFITTPNTLPEVLVKNTKDLLLLSGGGAINNLYTDTSSVTGAFAVSSGGTNFVQKVINGIKLGNSQIFDNGTSIGIGTSTPTATRLLDIQNSIAGKTVLAAVGVNGYIVVDNVGSGANLYDASASHSFSIGGVNKLIINTTGASVSGNVTATNIYSTSATPTITLGAGAGTGATASIVGNNQDGKITVVVGSTGLATGTVCTITLNGFSYPIECTPTISPLGLTTIGVTGSYGFGIGAVTANTFTLATTNSTSAGAGATFTWTYHNGGH